MSDRGSVSIVAVGVLVIVMVLTMGAADVASALIARERAQQAADAAALAAAQQQLLPAGGTPAEVAAVYAGRNGAALSACTCPVGATEAVVTVTVPLSHLLLLPGQHTVIARARAVVDPP